MISATEAKNRAMCGRLEYLDQKIKERADHHYRSLSLIGEFRLEDDDKKILKEHGYTILIGDSGKHGKFDIIKW